MRVKDVADLVRRCTRLAGRHGFRVVARGSSGHIFFDAGRVVHAEFGEDCGLRAVIEMLRVGPVQLDAAVQPCPLQPSLNLSPELLLSMTERDASRVMRKVELPVEPPPLPEPEALGGASLVAPVHPGALRSSGIRRAISAVLPRVQAPPASEPPRPGLVGEPAAPPASVPAPSGTQTSASARAPASAQTAASSVSARRLAAGRSASIPMSSITLRAAREPAEAQPRLPRAPAPAAVPVVRAQEPRSRAVVARRSSQRAAAAAAGEARVPPPEHAPALPAAEGEPTTMVRVTARGDVLAERGQSSAQLAEAAAFIHGLTKLIAADLGRTGAQEPGRANVHLSGQGLSLLVARSEVNDIAAALGPSQRLAPLLRRVGLR